VFFSGCFKTFLILSSYTAFKPQLNVNIYLYLYICNYCRSGLKRCMVRQCMAVPLYQSGPLPFSVSVSLSSVSASIIVEDGDGSVSEVMSCIYDHRHRLPAAAAAAAVTCRDAQIESAADVISRSRRRQAVSRRT